MGIMGSIHTLTMATSSLVEYGVTTSSSESSELTEESAISVEVISGMGELEGVHTQSLYRRLTALRPTPDCRNGGHVSAPKN